MNGNGERKEIKNIDSFFSDFSYRELIDIIFGVESIYDKCNVCFNAQKRGKDSIEMPYQKEVLANLRSGYGMFLVFDLKEYSDKALQMREACAQCQCDKMRAIFADYRKIIVEKVVNAAKERKEHIDSKMNTKHEETGKSYE